MCTTTNRATQVVSAAAEAVRIIAKPPAAVTPPPGLFPAAFTLLDNNRAAGDILFDAFKKVTAKAKYKRLPFAVIDYTSGTPAYLGNNDKNQTFVASQAKLGVLFAALWLRKTARENARKSTAADLAGVLSELTTKWLQTDKPFPDRFKKNIIPSKTWPPNLDDIFSGQFSNGEWKLDFTSAHDFRGAGRPASLDFLVPFDGMSESGEAAKNAKKAAIGALGFRERLELMVSWSDNIAAFSCVNALGYQFINGCLEAAGFYNRDKTKGGGFWMSKNYDRLGGDGSDFQQVSPQSTTAQIAANAMWLAVKNQLIDQESSEDWMLMTEKAYYTNNPNPPAGGIQSLIGDELGPKQQLHIAQLNSKIGIFFDERIKNGQKEYFNFHYSDTANVHEDDSVKGRLKYIISICFSGDTDNTAGVLSSLAFELEKAIKQAN